LEQELAYSLGIIISLLAKFPKDLGLVALKAATLSSVTGVGATRQHGAGVVVIVGNTNRESCRCWWEAVSGPDLALVHL
jgi:hypothetical protein